MPRTQRLTSMLVGACAVAGLAGCGSDSLIAPDAVPVQVFQSTLNIPASSVAVVVFQVDQAGVVRSVVDWNNFLNDIDTAILFWARRRGVRITMPWCKGPQVPSRSMTTRCASRRSSRQRSPPAPTRWWCGISPCSRTKCSAIESRSSDRLGGSRCMNVLPPEPAEDQGVQSSSTRCGSPCRAVCRYHDARRNQKK